MSEIDSGLEASEIDSGLEAKVADTLMEALLDSSRQRIAAEMWYDLQNKASELGEPLWTLSLAADYRVFGSTVSLLRRWGRETFPGVRLGDSALPANPINQHVMFAEDPLSEQLRDAWKKDYIESSHSSEAGDMIAIPMPKAIEIFSRGLARSAAQSVSSSNKLIKFTVKTQQTGFRILRTDPYWYQPKVFGGIKVSTPVDDRIYGGTYKFGGDNFGVVTPIWDHVTHTVSAANPSTTLTAI